VSNTIHLIGNVASVITRNDYPRPDGEVLTKIRFLLATDKDLKPRPDGKPWPADYIPVEVWGATARAVAEYKGKGSKLAIRGRLKGEFYRPEGAEKDVLQVAVVADRVDFLGPKRADENGSMAATSEPAPETAEARPTARPAVGTRR
jgi:single-stranded DNA-binding protein